MTDPKKPLKILLVDDQPEILDLLAEGFQDTPCTLFRAEDGARASYMAETDHFDAILTDLKMPKASGLEFIARVRATKLNATTKIFLITGYPDADAIKRVVALGVASVILKPFDAIAVAKQVLERIQPPPSKNVYDAKFINCCLDTAKTITEFYLGASSVIGKATLKDERSDNGYATGLISFAQNNKVIGSLSFSMDQTFIAHFAKSIFGDNSGPISDQMAGDMTGELSNQLVGKLKIFLAQEHYYITVGLPEVIVGQHHRFTHKVANPVLRIPISCADGRAFLEICLAAAIEKGAAPPPAEPDKAPGGDTMFF
jgi:CheY-like chemotaxis protein